VSAGVARKEHGEFSSNIDLIDVLPPGLYEAVFERKTDTSQGADLASGEWIMRCEQRTLDDIRALGGNDPADERRFATVAKVSEMNLAAYRTFMQPWVRAMVTPAVAEAMREMHPLRLQYQLFSDANPLMAQVAEAAEKIRDKRTPVASDNPFTTLQETMSRQIVAGLDAYRDMRDGFGEALFLSVYGSPALQAAVGLDPADTGPQRRAGKSPLHAELVNTRIAQLKEHMTAGGVREGTIRALIYAGMPRAALDERGVAALRRIRTASEGAARMTLAEFKAMVREQFLMLLIDPAAAVAAIPRLIPDEGDTRRKSMAALHQVLSARGPITGEVAERLHKIAELLGVDAAPADTNVTTLPKAS
jgi:Protein of unknown function (DUF3141)